LKGVWNEPSRWIDSPSIWLAKIAIQSGYGSPISAESVAPIPCFGKKKLTLFTGTVRH